MGRASSGGGSAGAFSAGLARAPRLEIKKDPKGMVTVPGATTIEVSTALALQTYRCVTVQYQQSDSSAVARDLPESIHMRLCNMQPCRSSCQRLVKAALLASKHAMQPLPHAAPHAPEPRRACAGGVGTRAAGGDRRGAAAQLLPHVALQTLKSCPRARR